MDSNGTYDRMVLRPNNCTYMNPLIPFLTATPDGLVTKGATEIIGVVEVKDYGFKNLDEIWKASTKDNPTIGIVGFRGKV